MKSVSVSVSIALTLALLLPAPSARAQADAAAPLLVVTASSYDSVAAALERIIDAVEPGQAKKMVRQMDQSLRLKGIEGFDPARPIQGALWIGAFTQTPVVAVHLPVRDFAAARPGINELLPPKGNFVVEPHGPGYARILMAGGEDTPAASVAAAKALPAPAKPAHTLALSLRPNKDTREQIKGVLAMARLSMGSLMKEAELPEGMDSQAYADMLGVYLDFATTLVDGIGKVHGGYDVAEDAIVSDFKLTPTPGSEVAGIFRNVEATPFEMEKLPISSAPMWIAGKIGKWDGAREMLEKITSLGYKMMQQEVDEDLVRQWGDLAEEMLPLQYAFALDFKDIMSFGGIYRFPASRDAGALMDKMMQLTERSVKDQIGANGIYKSFKHQKALQTIGGVSVDRVEYAFNPESPMFADPETAKMMKKMYGDTIRFDMGNKGKSVLFSTPDRTQSLFTGAGAGTVPAGLNPTRDSAFLMSFNLIGLIRSFSGIVGEEMPQAELEKLKNLPSEGTDITLQADVKGDAHVVVRVPLALLTSFASMEKED